MAWSSFRASAYEERLLLHAHRRVDEQPRQKRDAAGGADRAAERHALLAHRAHRQLAQVLERREPARLVALAQRREELEDDRVGLLRLLEVVERPLLLLLQPLPLLLHLRARLLLLLLRLPLLLLQHHALLLHDELLLLLHDHLHLLLLLLHLLLLEAHCATLRLELHALPLHLVPALLHLQLLLLLGEVAPHGREGLPLGQVTLPFLELRSQGSQLLVRHGGGRPPLQREPAHPSDGRVRANRTMIDRYFS